MEPLDLHVGVLPLGVRNRLAVDREIFANGWPLG